MILDHPTESGRPFFDVASGVRSTISVAFASIGQVGVVFFFILSGFVLTWSARAGESRRSFWQRRFARIYPNHAVMLVVSVVAFAVVGLQVHPKQILTQALLIQAWIPNENMLFSLNVVTWTLSCEAFFYFMLPFLLPRLRSLSTSTLYRVAGLCAALEIGMDLVVTQLHWTGWAQILVSGHVPLFRLPEFLVGVCLALLAQRQVWRGPNILTCVALTGVAYAVQTQAPFPLEKGTLTIVPLALLVAAAARADLAGQPSLLASRPVVWLGEVSFAFYMVHYIPVALAVEAHVLPDSVGPIGALTMAIGFFALAFGMATALYLLVEKRMISVLAPRARARHLRSEEGVA